MLAGRAHLATFDQPFRVGKLRSIFMKNTNKLKFIIALAVIIGLIMIACNNGTDEGEGGNLTTTGGGGLTITGIPAEHNGRHALFINSGYTNGGFFPIWGFVSVDMQNETFTLPRISGDRVTIPMWTSDANDNAERFTGNASYVTGWVFIVGSATVAFYDIDSGNVFYAEREWERINFQDGNANITWGSGIPVPPGQ